MNEGLKVSSESDWVRRLPFYYGWVMVVLSSIAMTATLPGRSHGLSLVNEKLITDLSISRVDLGRINFWSSILGAGFCIPVGAWIDRYGVRRVFIPVVVGLALAVFAMSQATGPASLFAAFIFIRGLGQSALSVVSMAMIGKWFGQRAGLAMGVFSVLMGMGFGGSIEGMSRAIEASGWRDAWFGLGGLLLGFAPIGWFFIRNSPEACGLAVDKSLIEARGPSKGPRIGYTLSFALRQPAFWAFVLGTAIFNLVWTAVMFWNESIMKEIGFDENVAKNMLIVFGTVGLVVNLVCGAIAKRGRLGLLLGIGLAFLTAALAAFPKISTETQLHLYSAATGVSSGIVMVVFFSVWGQVFGRAHVGHIQGAAQVISVLASAIGPELLARQQAASGSYRPAFSTMAIGVGILAAFAFVVRLPPDPVLSEEPRYIEDPQLALPTAQES